MIDHVAIKTKYGNFWGEAYSSVGEFRTKYMIIDYFYIMYWQQENGNTIVEVCDGDMHSEIVIIEGMHEYTEYEKLLPVVAMAEIKEVITQMPRNDLFAEYRDGINGVITE